MRKHAFLFGLGHRPVAIHSNVDQEGYVLVEALWAERRGEDRVYLESCLQDRPLPPSFWHDIRWV